MGPGRARSAGWRWNRASSLLDRRSEPRTGRHDPAVLDRRACSAPGLRRRDGRHGDRRTPMTARFGASVNWMQSRPGDAGRLLGAAGHFSSARGRRSSTAVPNMFTLIALGVGAAYLYSAAGHGRPGLFPEGFRMHGVVETYFDTAVVITVLVLLGQVLELRARSRHERAIRRLLGLTPKTARVVDGMDRGRCRPGRRHGRAISAASGPARKCRSTASSSRDGAPSTNRWSPANRCR